MKTITLIIFLIISNKTAFCQSMFKLDSLLEVLPTLSEDTTKAKTYYRIARILAFSDPERSLEYGFKALALSEKLDFNKGIVNAYARLGDAKENQGDDVSALKFRLKELKKYQEINDQKEVCRVMENIGISYSNLGDNLKALEYYIQSLNLAEKFRYTNVIVDCQQNIAVIYYEKKNYKKALEYFNKALLVAKQNKFENSISAIYANVGQIYSDLGKYNEALKQYSLALEICKNLNRKMHMAMILGNIGVTLSCQADTAYSKGNTSESSTLNRKAIESFKKAVIISKEIENEHLTSSFLGNISNLLRVTKQFEEGEELLKESMKLASTINATDVIIDNHHRFFQFYKETKRPELAILHYERYNIMKDSLSNIDNKTAISELQIKYDTEKKETENIKLEQKNKILELSLINNKYLTFALISFSLLIFGIGFLLIRQNKLKSKQENAKLEQKLLRTQMNPHFIFNSLANIESFIYEHQPKEAGNYLAQFARLMRLILENSSSEYITLEKELETLKYYFSLQKLRLNDNLNYKIEIDENINTTSVLLPPMLTQPFIENAIEHGFRGISDRGKIIVKFSAIKNGLEIKITDNGIGISKAQQQKELYKKHNSMAMKITHERLKYLNKSKNQKLAFSIKEIEQGTEVTFSIPI